MDARMDDKTSFVGDTAAWLPSPYNIPLLVDLDQVRDSHNFMPGSQTAILRYCQLTSKITYD